jgi:competence protein ComEA
VWETIREYLILTRKERFGVLFLLAIIILLFVLPYFFRAKPGEPDPATFAKLETEIEKFKTTHPDSTTIAVSHHRDEGRKPGWSSAEAPVINEKTKLFFFDPNTMTIGAWRQLGLPEHTMQTITHFLAKGGRFNKPEDLKKIYGLRPELYERLFPFIRISKKSESVLQPPPNPVATTAPIPSIAITTHSYYSKKLETTDINLADSLQWCRLPGIGSRLASRIIHFREKLGGFYTTDQVAETFGLPDSTFQKIKPVLICHSPGLVLIDINNVSKETLQGHPYIRWQMANAIVEYRNQHGHFQHVNDLMQIGLIDTLQFIRMRPYLTVNP